MALLSLCSVTSLRTSRLVENVSIRWTSWTRGRTCDTARYVKASLLVAVA